MANLEEQLAKQAAEIEPPKPIPVGTYLCIVDGQPTFLQLGQNKTDAVDFMMKIAQPMDDVDQSALAEFTAKGDVIAGKRIKRRLFLTEDSIFMLKQFLTDSLGIDETGKTLKQMIPEALGKQVYATVKHRSSDDGQRVFSEVASTAKV